MDDWRKFFKTAKADIFEVIEYGIRVAAFDCPNEFKLRRDRIAEILFTCTFTGLGHPRPRDLEEDEEERDRDDDVYELNKVNSAGNDIRSSSNISYVEVEALTDELEEENRLVVEVIRIREILENSQDESPEALFESLRRLELMHLSVPTLEATHIGKAVNRLKKHGELQVRQLARSLVDGWKALYIDYYTAREAVKGNSDSPDSVNPPVNEDEECLPSPPLDDFGAFLGVQPDAIELSKFFDGMDDYGNPPSNGEFDKTHENERKLTPEKSNIQRETKNSERRKPQLAHVEVVSSKEKNNDLIVKQDTVTKQSKLSDKPLGQRGPHNNSSVLKINSDVKLEQKMETLRNQKRPDQQNKLKCPGEVLDQKLAASKRRLQENYQQAQNAKKQRTIQTLELSDLPKKHGSTILRPGYHNRQRR